MTNSDIPALIERLRARRKMIDASTFVTDWDAEYAADALERLTASPLPEEVAELVERLRRMVLASTPGSSTIMGAAAMLERMGCEVERLNREINEALMLTECCSSLKDMAAACIEGVMWKDRAEKAETRIAEGRASHIEQDDDGQPDEATEWRDFDPEC